ncbi:MAG: hypothetical protein RLZZ584_984 [Pseudomonadota bacterium]
MKKIWILVALVAAFGTGAANAANPNLIVNGSFEAQTIPNVTPYYQYVGSLTGWNGTSNWRGFVLFNGNYQPVADGINAVQFEYPADNLWQEFSTTIGQAYRLTYSLSACCGPAYPRVGDLSVTVGNVTDNTTSSTNVFAAHTLDFTATDTTTRLTFTSSNPSFDASYPQLDNISVTAITAAVPEPGSYTMLMAGLGVVGALARRRRRQA